MFPFKHDYYQPSLKKEVGRRNRDEGLKGTSGYIES